MKTILRTLLIAALICAFGAGFAYAAEEDATKTERPKPLKIISEDGKVTTVIPILPEDEAAEQKVS